ncbi:MAG: hypothetical protein LBM39_02205 [Candidatus Methanoplasma sp.]|nr:hypothetical protein [Candidatus Methanoplasma sp.]
MKNCFYGDLTVPINPKALSEGKVVRSFSSTVEFKVVGRQHLLSKKE